MPRSEVVDQVQPSGQSSLDRSPAQRPSHRRLLFVDLHFFLLALVATGIAVRLSAEPYSIRVQPRMFYLADASLWNAYKHHDTVPIWTVFITAYIGFAAVVGIGEYRLATRIRRVSPSQAQWIALRFAFGLWVSTMAATMLVECTKSYVGRLRPNFAERCLGPGAVPPPHNDPVSLLRIIRDDAECTFPATPMGRLWDGRRSFPSGHAALAMGAAVYFQLWLMRTSPSVQNLPMAFASAVAGVLAIGYGLYVSASRVVDNAHHVSDIVGGAAIGGLLAAVHFWKLERETSSIEQQWVDGHIALNITNSVLLDGAAPGKNQ